MRFSGKYLFTFISPKFQFALFLAQEFILNKQPNQDINEYEEYLLEHQQQQTTTTKQQPQLSPGEQLALIDHKQRMLNRTSAEREMTPDSINNDEDILEVVTDNTNSRQKTSLKSKQPIVQQKKKIPLNQRPNGAPNTNKAQAQAIQKATPKTNRQQPTSKVSATSNRQSVSSKKTIPAKLTASSTRVATQPTKPISKSTTIAGKQQSMPALTQARRQQQQQIVDKTTNKNVGKAAVPKQQQQKPAVSNKALVNAKVMPVVEEGLSNDELNGDDEDEEAEEELEQEENVPSLIEYEEDDRGNSTHCHTTPLEL